MAHQLGTTALVKSRKHDKPLGGTQMVLAGGRVSRLNYTCIPKCF